ncbi:efflux RND transporter periplasmic adaptor subunit [Phaeovulum vinaykumarii]|uniref:Membrane fusion protein, multidrug efflux system n=1 Tax=Phaeovulum vinaykumarii TaxID=407234 RepID=A0A1N7K119_9RHOB|nr:efflux RND transporter periplasmic adaptor subunit [Phaeovulum vinaykumarii]SIS55280.1 membrane fusion protein, multidrug efflux system [Phaeovulum vinaykumarii]SOB92308.1 membrane fusion protein (multidrug efflux system) [Phaeovulum vinaykumarii]
MLKRIIVIVLVLVVAGGVVGFNLFRDQMITQIFANMKPKPVTVSTSTVVPIDWTPGLEAIGTANAAAGVDLSIEAAGTVSEIAFEANDKVSEGQLLVQIDDRSERADLTAAEAALVLARTELERARQLSSRGAQSRDTLDSAQAAYDQAVATVAKLHAVLDTKRLDAPFAGVIGIPQVERGQYVTAGTVYATLQDLDRMRVDFTLPEQDKGLISRGQKVVVTSEVGDITASGRIVGIEPKVDPNSRLVTIRAEVDNAGGRITPGQFLSVRVQLPEETGVIALPQTVVASNLYGDSVYLVREEQGEDGPVLKVAQVFVKLGRRSGDLVEIIEGVAPGDRVVNAGQNKLNPGAVVKIDNSVSPDPASGETPASEDAAPQDGADAPANGQ